MSADAKTRYRERNRAAINERAAQRRRARGVAERPKGRQITNAANVARWRRENPERARELKRAAQARRRARLRGVEHETIDPRVVWERDEGVCGICGEPADRADWQMDHVVPIARGGAHVLANVQVSHPICNRRKWAHGV